LRHFDTVCRVHSSSLATSWFATPAAHASTIRDRRANACAVLRRRAHACSCSRSASFNLTCAFGRPAIAPSLSRSPYTWDSKVEQW